MIENRSSFKIVGIQVASVYAALYLVWLFALLALLMLFHHPCVGTHLSSNLIIMSAYLVLYY